MSNRQRRLLVAAVIVGAAGLNKLASLSGIPVDGIPNAPQSATSTRDAYADCLRWTGGSQEACDNIVFGGPITEDDEQGRWLCDLMGNRQCSESEL